MSNTIEIRKSKEDILCDELCKEIWEELKKSDINVIRQNYIDLGLSEIDVDTTINDAFELYLGDRNYG